MIRRILTALAIAPLHLLVGCGEPRAGTSTQTENHFGMREMPIDSILPTDDTGRGTTVSTLRLDSANFDFSQADSNGGSLAVERLDGSPIPFRIVFWDRRSALGRLQVRIDSALRASRSSIVLRWNAPASNRSDSAAVWRNLSPRQFLSLSSVLVDDFEDGQNGTLLPNQGSWLDSATAAAKFSNFGIFAAPAGHGGKALHFTHAADSITGQYVLIKTPLAATPRCLRSLDSIVLWVRGSGVFTMAFENLSRPVPSKAWQNWTIDSTAWRKFVVSPKDLLPADNKFGNVGWAGVRDSITHITFFMTGNGEFWIDDIRLHGIVSGDLR